jgi:hypothetical protein
MNAALQSPVHLVTGLTPLDAHRARGVPMLSYMNFPLFTQQDGSMHSKTAQGRPVAVNLTLKRGFDWRRLWTRRRRL